MITKDLPLVLRGSAELGYVQTWGMRHVHDESIGKHNKLKTHNMQLHNVGYLVRKI